MEEIIKQVATQGIGGILALCMFLLYRKDLAEAQRRVDTYAGEFRSVVTENTRAVVTLTEYIKRFDPGEGNE